MTSSNGTEKIKTGGKPKGRIRTPSSYRKEYSNAIQVRLPPEMREQLQGMADANCRSISQEIQFRLMRDLQASGEDK